MKKQCHKILQMKKGNRLILYTPPMQTYYSWMLMEAIKKSNEAQNGFLQRLEHLFEKLYHLERCLIPYGSSFGWIFESGGMGENLKGAKKHHTPSTPLKVVAGCARNIRGATILKIPEIILHNWTLRRAPHPSQQLLRFFMSMWYSSVQVSATRCEIAAVILSLSIA